MGNTNEKQGFLTTRCNEALFTVTSSQIILSRIGQTHGHVDTSQQWEALIVFDQK